MQDLYRVLDEELDFGLDNFPVIAILGPRQCGKSFIAKQIAKKNPNAIYLDMESRIDLAKLENPELYFEKNSEKLICLDEIQRIPEIFPVLRSIVDKTNRNGQILVLGSASPELLKQSSESLAGRIIYLYLTPFTAFEVYKNNLYKQDEHWFKGGFPMSFFKQDKASNLWRENYIKTFVERDLFQFGFKTTSTNFFRFFQMLSHSHGQVLNLSKLGASLGISHNTISHYVDIFRETFLIRSLQPYYQNLKKRLIKSPKIYIRDSGILHSMLKIDSFNDLLGHPVLGFSWEGYCIEQILSTLKGYDSYFYRTSSGAEIDLVLVKGEKKIAVEFKISPNPKPDIGFWNSLKDLEIEEAYIICPISDSYPIHKTVEVMGLIQFLEKFS